VEAVIAKPKFLPWNEEEFQADVYVRAMTPAQRWMYRTVLQASFFVTSRPRLPNDDNQLWTLAGCASKREWLRNKSVVIARFNIVEIDGVQYIENKRVLKDWAVLVEARERMVEMGKKSAEIRRTFSNGSTKAEPTLNTGSRPVEQEKLREVKVSEVREKLSEVNESETGGQEEETEMAFIQNLENTAAEILKFRKGMSPSEKKEYKLLGRAYDTARVEDDFRAWAEENRGGDGIKYPFSLYLKKCDDRLKAELEPEIADDPRIRQLSSKIYELTGRLPVGVALTVIQKQLTKYEISDIIAGFSEYISGLDAFETKWSVKNFFTDGAGDVVIDGVIKRRNTTWKVNDAEVDPFFSQAKTEEEKADEAANALEI
jgi:uncharacterized protein YdaU (DUF1376 family)